MQGKCPRISGVTPRVPEIPQPRAAMVRTYTTCAFARSMTNQPQDSLSAQPHPGENGGGPFLVIGLGASAGGIKALQEFFAHVPPRSGAAYVVILHLSPDHDSRLAEVLQATAFIPVAQVRERVTIEADHVYVIPPHKGLVLEGGYCSLRDDARRAATCAGGYLFSNAGGCLWGEGGCGRSVRDRL